ncbi:sigma-70 family RNA polymerase sigma factor [Moorena sp. SIO3B2]|uniref:RNA polymerase sigma factor n=1 Tax=Moorena sp. SIO3B2 TaxID=2607827 RepID=UPI0013CB76FD|nr:sigma-70 family RNA polymerase sigma factor [Moorena sp. SIO3B2]NEP34914.1 sigma-70 family RNA polymerase sigma factor [Moorena sp. SIO3B2]
MENSKITTTQLSLPKGGGAIQGIGETFQANEFTGTAGLSIPIPTTPCRGFEPQLSVQYSSGSGNGPFGLGFALAIPIDMGAGSQGMPIAATRNRVSSPDRGNRKNPKKLERGGIVEEFWQQWSQHQEALYRCCLQLMNFNPTDAEDALSRAMLKAVEKVKKFAGKIANFKAWLRKLTYNVCIDIIRERSRGPAAVESIEWVGNTEEMSTSSAVESPETFLEREERSIEIRRVIASLPERMRETFILHFYEELTHTEIAERQGISYDSVCKRISIARKKLKQMLSAYFIESEVAVPSTASSEAGIQKSGKKSEDWAEASVQPKKSPTPGEYGEKQKERSAEEKKGLETATDSAEIECAEVVVAEKPERVDGAVGPRELVDENISNLINVSDELPLCSREAVALPSSMLDETWAERGGAIASLSKQLRNRFSLHFYRELTHPEIAMGQKWIVPNSRMAPVSLQDSTRDDIWTEKGGAIASLLERGRSRLIRGFYQELTHLEKTEQDLWKADAIVNTVCFVAESGLTQSPLNNQIMGNFDIIILQNWVFRGAKPTQLRKSYEFDTG